jgi:hypothetical protein
MSSVNDGVFEGSMKGTQGGQLLHMAPDLAKSQPVYYSKNSSGPFTEPEIANAANYSA